ncbi:MAG: GNAT family N-acetyltransferase [Chloroflexota bacterium]
MTDPARADDAAGHLPDAPPIPGLAFRRWRGPDDLPEMHRVATAAKRSVGDPSLFSLEEMQVQYRNLTNCDPYRDVLLAEVDGTLVAYARTWWEDRSDGVRLHWTFGLVHPAWRRRGIGGALAGRLEAHAEALAAADPSERTRRFASFSEERDAGAVTLLTQRGYEVDRRFATMHRPTLDDVVETPVPEGFTVRPATRADMRAIFEADVEAFADHWGTPDGSDAAWQRFQERPGIDPSLWAVAWAGDEVAAAVLPELTHPAVTGEPQTAWLSRIFTRRPWRRRGLARMLVGRSLVQLRERGLADARLGVDLANAHDALTLYAAAGFVIETTETLWGKPWPGLSGAAGSP